MSYVSPIKIGYAAEPEEGWTDKIGKYIAGEVDNLVLESCVKVGCHVDKDELEKALRYDRDQYSKGYADGKRDAAPRWHRVEEELPSEFQYVWAACKMNGRENWTIETVYDPYLSCPWGYNIPVLESGKAVVYAWMDRSAPEPPKEDA